ncbi:MAG: hypothetical protein IJ011_07480 [Clostridia bacterium]|nr:hypothetical protein [Clostridia bacterium]
MFKKAIPVFAEGKERELNYRLELRAETDSLKDTTLYISAFSFYRLTVNGRFVAFGPARAAGGYARVDVLPLDRFSIEGKKNEIVIEVAGYNCGSLSTVRQSSFVVAELRRGDEPILYTGRDFSGYRSAKCLQKTERYSAQRHFGEVFDLSEKEPYSEKYAVKLTAAENTPKYLERRVPYPKYDVIYADGFASSGRFRYEADLPCRLTRTSFAISKEWGRFDEDEIPYKPFRWIQKQRQEQKTGKGSLPIQLSAGDYVIVDLGKIETGFIGICADALEDADVVVGFSEYCSPNKFEFTRINMQNVFEYTAKAGDKIDAESFEPYTCRLATVMVKMGTVRLNSFCLRTFEQDRERLIPRKIKDTELAEIYKAAESTFVHNAVDLYTDCPSRERAGWLCDSFFTGRAEYFLTGKSSVEDAFLENYRLYEYNGEYPKGVLPMCYPADEHENGKFIPQWDMWYVIEVKEYLTKRNTSIDKELFRDSVYGVISFLESHENADGLLQDLPSWNFVEWSTANDWVQNVNYPTNFLYAEVLRAAAELYGDKTLAEKAERVAKRTAALSFDGEVFVDNAVKDWDGKLVNTKNSSEAGQYYAILFGGFDLNDKKYEKLKAHVRSGFAYFDAEGIEYVPVNAFIGFYLRILTLMKIDEPELLRTDLKRFFGGMVESTGTLWEYMEGKGSRDHGFASLAALAIDYIESKEK